MNEQGEKVNIKYVLVKRGLGSRRGRALETHRSHTLSKAPCLYHKAEAKRISSSSPLTAALERVLESIQIIN